MNQTGICKKSPALTRENFAQKLINQNNQIKSVFVNNYQEIFDSENFLQEMLTFKWIKLALN